jgi:hypothetical protein
MLQRYILLSTTYLLQQCYTIGGILYRILHSAVTCVSCVSYTAVVHNNKNEVTLCCLRLLLTILCDRCCNTLTDTAMDSSNRESMLAKPLTAVAAVCMRFNGCFWGAAVV